MDRIKNANEASQKLRKSLEIVVPAEVHEKPARGFR
jgi:hypothetical protein